MESISTVLIEMNKMKKEIQQAEARYDELQVDCSTMVDAIKKLLKSETSESNQISQIALMLDTFPEKHMTGSGDSAKVNYF